MKRRNIGSSLDSWLREDGAYDRASAAAIGRNMARRQAATRSERTSQAGSIRRGRLRASPAPSQALTRDINETINARADRDPKFRKELLREGIESMLSGDIATGKTILRDYINATVGFAELAEAMHIPSKSLMRMLGPSGNPRADNLFEVVSFLQRREGVRFHVKAAPA